MEPLSCVDARVLASAAADDELVADEQRSLEHHLAACAACESYVERLATLTRGVRLRPVANDVDLTDRILSRARPPRLGRGGWLRPALAWAGLVIGAQSIGRSASVQNRIRYIACS